MKRKLNTSSSVHADSYDYEELTYSQVQMRRKLVDLLKELYDTYKSNEFDRTYDVLVNDPKFVNSVSNELGYLENLV